MDEREEAEWARLVDDDWLSARQAAEVLGVGVATLHELVDQGRLRAYRPARWLRWRRSDILAYLRSVEVEPGTVAEGDTEAE